MELSKKIIQDVKESGGKLLRKSDELISHFAFKTASNAQDAYFKISKKYPGADFYTRGCRLCIYGLDV